MKFFITSYFEIEGLHCWPGVVETNATEQYLSVPHRHIFKFRIKVPVTHTDRDVEFIEFAHQAKEALLSNFSRKGIPFVADFGSASCEALAVYILNKFPQAVSCEVTEDGESGAIIERS